MIADKIIISDLDGTLLPSNGKVNTQIIEDFKKLKEEGFVRVIATGRSVYSSYQAIDKNFPIDYLVFSSGSGIMKWDTKEIIFQKYLNNKQTKITSEILIRNKTNFMIHDEIPNNHHFKYHIGNTSTKDFEKRLKTYHPFCSPIKDINDCDTKSCQILAILSNDINKFNLLSKLIPNVKIIRSTSPIDNESIWLEVFPEDVSKGLSCQWLMNKLNIETKNSIGIGNDYNDIDFLDICNKSYIVANAQEELKIRYTNIPCLFDKDIISTLHNIL